MKKSLVLLALLCLLALPIASAQDAPTLTEAITLSGHESSIRKLAWSPDGTLIASTSADSTARVWDVETGETLHTITYYAENDADVNGIAFSPDGSQFVTVGGVDIIWWDTETGEEVNRFSFNGGVSLHVAWSSADVVAVGTSAASVTYFTPEGDILNGFESRSVTRIFDWSPDGELIASTETSEINSIFNLDAQQVMPLVNENAEIFVAQGIDWANEANVVGMYSSTKGVAAWDADTGEVLWYAEELPDTPSSVVVSNDGAWFSYGDTDKLVHFIDLASGEEVLALEVAGFPDALQWSPDGTQFAVGMTGSSTNHIVIYNVE